MHFIPEAFYRRPLEPRSLVYGRATTATVMGMAFLAFIGYLASQIYYDKPLIYISTETVPFDIQPADVEFCVQKSSMTVVGCGVTFTNWTNYLIPNCTGRFFREGADNPDQHCYVFETNGTYRMTAGNVLNDPAYADSVRRFDIYWKIDDHSNYTGVSASVPAIALKLYYPTFSNWKVATLMHTPVEDQMLKDIDLGYQHAYTYINTSSSIYYTPQKYREILPGNARALLGLGPDYHDIITLDAKQMDIPLNDVSAPSALVNHSDYDGLASFLLSKATIDVQTESRQHTLLAAVALAGGCYGVLTTLYILLFGMTRLTPWGLVHHIPVFISNHRHNKKDDKVFMDAMILDSSHDKNKNGDIESNDSALMDEFNNESAQKKKENLSTRLIPWFFRSNLKTKAVATDPNTSILERMMSLKRDSDQDSRIELGRRTSYHIDNDSRTQLPHASETPGSNPEQEDLNELSTTSDFLLNNAGKNRQSTSSMKKTPPSPQVSTSPTALFFNNNANESSRPPFSPTITKRASVSSDMMMYDQQEQQLQNTNRDSVTILTEVIKQEKEKNKELATRVDELEVILSQYFINTAYIDQLRTNREQSFIDGMNSNSVKRRSTKPSNNRE